MARIHVCPQAHVEAVLRSSGAKSVISLLSRGSTPPDCPGRHHLRLAVSDILAATPGHDLAEARHVAEILAFLADWDCRDPLLVHCYAGVSRSTAAAFIALCALEPSEPEVRHAMALRNASPTATPNRHLVALADDLLGRAGRMSAAIAAIGRGADCFEGNCFSLSVADRGAGALRAAMV